MRIDFSPVIFALILQHNTNYIVAVLNLVLTRHDSVMRKVMSGLISELTLAQDNGHKSQWSLESGDMRMGAHQSSAVQWTGCRGQYCHYYGYNLAAGECQVS